MQGTHVYLKAKQIQEGFYANVYFQAKQKQDIQHTGDG